MHKLNDYLYQGDTVFKILKIYRADLEKSALEEGNSIDLAHAAFLAQFSDLLEHNEFLTSQSQRIREFYKYMVSAYPYLAFTFKGRIKSLIRAEEKFNGYVVEQVYDYYKENNDFPKMDAVKNRIGYFRDIIAYRIVLSIPKCHIKPGQNREEEEIKILYEVANALPSFLEKRGFTVETAKRKEATVSPLLDESVRPYYRDYVANTGGFGYKSLHVTLFDNMSRSYVEIQLRTKEMDDFAEIGPANHLGYEKRQEFERGRRNEIPSGVCRYFDEAYDRVTSLQNLDLSEIDVNMFSAADNSLINDGCGLYRGRLILPFEHLSRFQNDV